MKINFLQWDTDFFGKKIGEVFMESSTHLNVEDDYDLIIQKQHIDFDTEISGFEQTFKETKINFLKTLNCQEKLDDSQIRDTDLYQKSAAFFKPLAYESGKKSRFLLDPGFGKEKFQKLYDIWVENSLNKKFAVKTFYIESNNQAVSFVTVQKYENIGKIGLIATAPDFQGQGFGKKLLTFAENYCQKNGMTELEIPTQKKNIQACNFYERLGYKIKDELIIKHFWKK